MTPLSKHKGPYRADRNRVIDATDNLVTCAVPAGDYRIIDACDLAQALASRLNRADELEAAIRDEHSRGHICMGHFCSICALSPALPPTTESET